MNQLSAWSIRNPIVPLLLFAGLVLAGIVAFRGMDVQGDPDIEFPFVIVSISQPGAAPTEIENQITQRVEAAIQTVDGIESISSTAGEGNSQTQVQFAIGTDINQAVIDVRNAIDQIRGELPDAILEPYIFKPSTTSNPIVYFSVAASDMTLEQLSWFVDDTVTKALLTVPGLAEVDRGGGVDREILVELDPAKMQSFGVTASQINGVLRQANLNAAGGRAEIAGSRQSVRVLGNAETAYRLSQEQIPLGGGRTVKLADIARVSDAYGEVSSISRIGETGVVTFSITRARGESDAAVYDEAVEVLQTLEEQNEGVKFTRLFNSVDYIKAQYDSSIAAMIEGAILAVVVVFLFLRDWRATVIASLAIPLSAIPAFWFMNLLGFSLNQMSLLALGLVAGVLVDDAIVEIENIVRHMRMGKSAYQASIEAADEIGLAVVATTFSIVAVFLPVGFMDGVHGVFFKNFALTVVAAVLMSLLVARMITPMMAAYFLKAKGHAEHGEGRAMDVYLRVLRWSLDRSGSDRRRARAMAKGGKVGWGTRIMARLVDHRVWMMGIGILALVATIACYVVIPKQFFPNSDEDTARISLQMVPGTTLAQTAEVSDGVADLLRAEPEVVMVLETVSEGSATLSVTLADDRTRSSQDFEREMAGPLSQVADARVSFINQQGGGGGGSNRAINVMLAGSDPDQLEETAQTLLGQMQQMDSLVGPRIEADLQRPELIVVPREDLAASLGVTTAAISQTIRIATIGDIDQNAARFSLSDRQVPIRVRLGENQRSNLGVIENLPVQTASGGSVPLSRVADIRFGSGPTSIERYNQSRRVFVSADLAPGVAQGTAQEAIDKLPILVDLPAGVTRDAVGAERWQQEMMADIAVALVTGIFLVFGVLVLLYRSLISPLVNMSSLFLAPLGGLLALMMIGQPLSLPVFIGILMLFGIVGKNSILLIDFAIEEMKAGRDKFHAVVEAGHKRAQPIVMTTIAMTAGMIPTALALSADGAWRQPMGTVVIGGLILSTVLTLLIVPAGFSLADGIENRIGPWLRRKILTYRPGDDRESELPAPAPAAPARPATRTPDSEPPPGALPAE